MIGLLTLSISILKAIPEFKEDAIIGKQLLTIIFEDCLFKVPDRMDFGLNNVPPKCKSHSSRLAAFHLLLHLSNGCLENITTLTELLSSQLEKGKQFSLLSFTFCVFIFFL